MDELEELEKIEADAKAGKFDKLVAEALAEYKAGKTRIRISRC